MRNVEAKKVMRIVFAGQPPERRANLRWHAKQKTPICCGADWEKFADGKGGG